MEKCIYLLFNYTGNISNILKKDKLSNLNYN